MLFLTVGYQNHVMANDSQISEVNVGDAVSTYAGPLNIIIDMACIKVAYRRDMVRISYKKHKL